ncbi:hypothetical protein BU17DRAFT_68697 [Hysterangium stoloniferum]|nr:hypothetical protein BU17DRAFT_68697 [Hysterangium stoloniferum]
MKPSSCNGYTPYGTSRIRKFNLKDQSSDDKQFLFYFPLEPTLGEDMQYSQTFSHWSRNFFSPYRPRTAQTTVFKQLYRDGAIYFFLSTSLRLLNVFILAKADIAYTQLAILFVQIHYPTHLY